jgi:hypothetical protein
MFIAPLLLAAGLNPAQPSTEAYTGVEPVQVAACSVAQQGGTTPGSDFGPLVPSIGSLNISFVDRDPKPVTRVEFAVSDGSTTIPVIDEGNFSSGVAINHNFQEPALSGGDVSCTVRSVAFADGSTWQAQ